MHPTTAAFVDAAAELGVDVVPRTFPDGTRTAEDAANALGVDVAQIVKSLAFRAVHHDGSRSVVMALVSGSNRLDEAALARVAHVDHTERADAAEVREASGFAIGGVPPFAHATPMAVFVDRDLLDFDVVWAAAGTPHDVFPISPDELVRASNGTIADLAR